MVFPDLQQHSSSLCFHCHVEFWCVVPGLFTCLSSNRKDTSHSRLGAVAKYRKDTSHSRLGAVTKYLEKAMAPHSSTPAWKIPWTEELGGLQSMGSQRVGHDWATSLLLFPFMHWRRKWQPTPVFLPGESQGRGSLVGCRIWGCTESDRTETT